MATDASIPLGMQPVNPMQNLSSLMGIAAQRQAISSSQTAQQGQQISNDNAGISLRERQALQPILSNPKAWTDPTTGDLDLNKLGPMVMQAAPTTGGDVIRTMIGVQQDRTNAKRLISTQTDENNTRVGSALASLPPDATSDDIDKTFGVIKSMYPNPDMQNVLSSMQGKLQKVMTHSNDPEQRQFAIQQAARMFLPQPTQQEMATPSGIPVSDNVSSSVISNKPGTTVPQGKPIPGTAVRLQAPIGTPTIGVGGQKGTLGAAAPVQPGETSDGIKAQIEAVQSNGGQPISPADKPAIDREVARLQQKLQEVQGAQSVPGRQFIPSDLPPGQAQNIANNVDEMNRHFSSLQDASSGAALQQGLIGNIKALSAGAATGTGAGRKAFVSGLLAAMHVPGTGDEAKDTDLLEKNMAQLNLATPASSDAMRTIVNAARPHGTMQEAAINEAADQLSGQISANMAMRNALSGYKMMGDINGYNQARQKLEAIADPRAWQYESLGPGTPQAKAFISKLTPADRSSLGAKIKQLEDMGILK